RFLSRPRPRSGTGTGSRRAGLLDQSPQCQDLLRPEFAELAGLQTPQSHRAEADAFEPHHLVADPRHQPADLAVAAFAEAQFEMCAVALLADRPHRLALELSPLEVHPLLELLQNLATRLAGNLHLVEP